MKLLLDTHTFMWFIDGSKKLHDYARYLIEDESNERLLSIASLWEMSIKSSLGKLSVTISFLDLVETQVKPNHIVLLPIVPAHLDTLRTLPFHHRDPFDRLLIAQSMVEGGVVLSRDAAFDPYPIRRIWSG